MKNTKSTLLHKIAAFISWIFIPLFTPIYGLLIVFYLPVKSASFIANESLYFLDNSIKLIFISLFLVFIVLAPGLSLVVMRLNKSISSLELENRMERGVPIVLVTFYYVVLYLFLIFQTNSQYIPSILKAVVLGGAITSFLSFFITKKIKISIHSIGMGGLFGFIYMFSLPLEHVPVKLLILILLLGGIVMSARLILKVHTLKEVGLGYFLGFIIQIICIYFYILFL